MIRIRIGSREATDERGAALLLTFLMMLVLSGLALAVGVFAQNSLVSGRSFLIDKQAFYIAEAGWHRARQAIEAETWSLPTGGGTTTNTESFGAGEYKVTTTDNGSSTYTITSEGYIPDQTNTIAKRKVEEINVVLTTASPNLSLAATASASSSKGNNTPDKGHDGATNTSWEANTQGSGEWLAMDFGSADTANKIVVLESKNIDGVNIQSSTDGSSWTTVSGLSVTESPAKTWTATFDATNAQHFRGVFTASGSNARVKVQELESYDTSDETTSLTAGDGYWTTW